MAYIWFLMLFPPLLITLFFVTLNFNHKVLYAPSDWKDETNFFRKFTNATPEEQEQKLKEEVTEEPEVEPEAQVLPAGFEETQRVIQRQKATAARVARYSLAERLAISKLSRQLNLSFTSGVRFQAGASRNLIFDAVAFEGDTVNAIEVKLVRTRSFMSHRFEPFLLETERVAKQLRDHGKDFVLHFVAVLDGADRPSMEGSIRKHLDRFDLNIKLYFYTMDELVGEIDTHTQ